MNSVSSKELKSVTKAANKAAGIEATARARNTISTENNAAFDEVISVAVDHLRHVQREIKRVEALIDFGAVVLRYAQPDIEGKVGVRWWYLEGRHPFRSPVLVRWMRAKTGKAAGRVAVPKKVTSLSGLFHGLHNSAVADAVAHELKDLIAYWASLVMMIRSVNLEAGRRMGGINRWARDLEYKQERLVYFRDELVKRMGKQGYALPDAFEEVKPAMPDR